MLAWALCALGCDHRENPTVQFEDRELLLGLRGRYKLDLSHEGSASQYTVVVRGDSVTASLATEDGVFAPRVIVWVQAVAEGVSVIGLHRGGRVLYSRPVDVATVTELHGELMLDLEDVLLEEPFALLAGDYALLRLAGVDARGRSFDRFYRELVAVDSGITLTQLWRNLYTLDTPTAGEFVVTADVDGRLLETNVHVLQPEDITSLHIAFPDDRTATVVGTDSDGRRVLLLDGWIIADGLRLYSYGVGLYSVPGHTPPGTVFTGTWAGMTTTYTF